MNNNQLNKVTLEQSATLMNNITFIELETIINGMNNTSAPGIDNLSNKLIKKIFPIICPFLLESFNRVYDGSDTFPIELKTST